MEELYEHSRKLATPITGNTILGVRVAEVFGHLIVQDVFLKPPRPRLCADSSRAKMILPPPHRFCMAFVMFCCVVGHVSHLVTS